MRGCVSLFRCRPLLPLTRRTKLGAWRVALEAWQFCQVRLASEESSRCPTRLKALGTFLYSESMARVCRQL